METVQHALATLTARPDVAGAALVSAEGLLVAAHLPPEADPEALAALMVTLARTASQAAVAGGRAGVNRVILEGAGTMTLAMPLVDGALLIILTTPGTPAGQLLFDLRQSRGDLAALLQPDVPGSPAGRP